MSKIYYVVKPSWSSVERYANEKDFDKVYRLIMFITGCHLTSSNVASWCELASVGEIYEDEKFTVTIVED